MLLMEIAGTATQAGIGRRVKGLIRGMEEEPVDSGSS